MAEWWMLAGEANRVMQRTGRWAGPWVPSWVVRALLGSGRHGNVLSREVFISRRMT